MATTIKQLFEEAVNYNLPAPKALIAPHAGFIYSGPIAATIYKTLIPHKDIIRRVILLGPAHQVAFDGIAVTRADRFVTPLGSILVDKTSINSILDVPEVRIFEKAYDMEHCLEVQLPFLQSILTKFTIVPCIVGNSQPINVANVIRKLWGDEHTLIVISSDLSHYLDYQTAQQLDTLTSVAIEQLEPESIKSNQACGSLPIKGLLIAAKELNLQPRILDVRNSGDTAGDRNRVVGYGAYHFV